MKTVDGEILAIHGEDFAQAFALGHSDERSIGEVHGTIGVFAHQFSNTRYVKGIERLQL